MNIIYNSVIIFVFIFLTLYLEFPIIKKDDAIMNKIYLFIGVFALQSIILSLDKLKKECKNSTADVAKEAIKIAFLSVIGYSFYIDMIVYPKYSSYISKYALNPRIGPIFTSFIISLFISIMKAIDNTLFHENCQLLV